MSLFRNAKEIGTLPKGFLITGIAISLGAVGFQLYKLIMNQKGLKSTPSATLKILLERDFHLPYLQADTVDLLELMISERCSLEYKEISLKNREKRRKFFRTDFLEYETLVVEGYSRLQALLRVATEKTTFDLGISFDKYMKSLERLWDLHKDQAHQIRRLAFNHLRKGIVDILERKLTSDQVNEGYIFVLEEYPLYKPHNIAYRRIIKDAYIQDAFYLKYGFEEEVLEYWAEVNKPNLKIEMHEANLDQLREIESNPFRGSNESLLMQIEKPVPAQLISLKQKQDGF